MHSTLFCKKRNFYRQEPYGRGVIVTGEIDRRKTESYHLEMINSGFVYDDKNNIYISPLGAFIRDILVSEMPTIHSDYRFETVIAEGCEVVFGPSSPHSLDDSVGVYCSNYMDILEKEKKR